ncbi:helix-turn-helix domain-containing protein [Gordonia sp. CPCC 206044]|uniref:helix-turn-helix domain-containing protein n=1 Tax=Gordonia sp. CPCC 206044 TaxID=3140793 RepID=UPI003AF3764C
MHDEENTDGADIAGDAAGSDPARGLAAVRALRTLADRLEEVQVANARANGWSWQSIAEVLQISRQAVHQKHAHREARDSGPGGETNNV